MTDHRYSLKLIHPDGQQLGPTDYHKSLEDVMKTVRLLEFGHGNHPNATLDIGEALVITREEDKKGQIAQKEGDTTE